MRKIDRHIFANGNIAIVDNYHGVYLGCEPPTVPGFAWMTNLNLKSISDKPVEAIQITHGKN